MSNWFKNQRLKWIERRVNPFNLSDLMLAFDISRVQASIDIRDFMEKYPDEIFYNKNKKQYEKSEY